jgi:hypothetical protein
LLPLSLAFSLRLPSCLCLFAVTLLLLPLLLLPFLANFPVAAGFLSIDVDGRVIRLDTLAKLLGPGFRLGWLAGPPELAAKFALYTAGTSIGANMLSQVCGFPEGVLCCWCHPTEAVLAG